MNSRSNSRSRFDYSYTDGSPHKGIWYYKLKQFDLDGRSEFSETLTVKHRKENIFHVFPTSSIDIVNIRHGDEGRADLWVSDFTSKVLVSKNNVKQAEQLDVSQLVRGAYIVE